MHPPIIGIPCDYRMLGLHPFHAAGDKYVRAVRESTGAVPLLIPAVGPPISPQEILATVDGLLFTGSPSNVASSHYNGVPPREGVLQDRNRDATTLPLLNAAISEGTPVLCLCRGFQELNVAMGGSLHQHVHELDGRLDHREDHDAPLDEQYGPAHQVRVLEGGLLGEILQETHFQVNSLHSQGINRLASPLHADAVAPDGTVEGVSMPEARGFVLGLQWHPEWRWSENPVSRQIFAAFAEAVQEHAGKRV
ncbi:MAG TPA: gamma-glutamyl-gamma-aminobutyrate hydrolase family protein [Rhizomicrobium sp.]